MNMAAGRPGFAAAGTSAAMRWTGRAFSTLVIVFLLLDGAIKIIPLPVVNQTLQQLGYAGSDALARGLGVLTLLCAGLYAWPRTAVAGAVLLTGLLGGAMASHLRVDSPLFSHLLFGGYLGLLAWAGLWLRDARLRTVLPWRRG
jgi:hypothetical protein